MKIWGSSSYYRSQHGEGTWETEEELEGSRPLASKWATTRGHQQLYRLQVFPQPDTGSGLLVKAPELCVYPRQQDTKWMLLFLPQCLCCGCLFRFLTTFSVSMLSNLHVLLTSSGVSRKHLYSSHLLAYCTEPHAIAQPDFETGCLPQGPPIPWLYPKLLRCAE